MEHNSEQHEESTVEETKAHYSRVAFDHATNPRNMGDMESADGFARMTGQCGDTMQIWLKIDSGVVIDATFTTDGCHNAIASCSMVTELAKGKSIVESKNIEQQDILDALGGLPEEGEHCAILAAKTLKAAIEDYLRRQAQSE